MLLDPPFEAGLLAPALEAAARIVREGGFVYAESGTPIAPPPALQPWREGRAGAVHHALLRRYTAAEPPATRAAP